MKEMQNSRCQLEYAYESNKEALLYAKKTLKRIERWYDCHAEYVEGLGDTITSLAAVVDKLDKKRKGLRRDLKIASK